MKDECVDVLKSHGFNCYTGTLGSLVKVPNESYGDSHHCLLNFDFPPNLHEYDIVIIDMQNAETIEYVPEDHTHSHVKSTKRFNFVSSYPQTLFDQRQCATSILKKRLLPLLKKDSFLIVFGTSNESFEYLAVTITGRGQEKHDSENYSLYDFYEDFPSYSNMVGKDTTVVAKSRLLRPLLEKHNSDITYRTTFAHPTKWTEDGYVEKDNFAPLIETGDGKIASFIHKRDKNLSFLFPYIKDKQTFLVDLLEKTLPSMLPNVFPYSSQFGWLSDEAYLLPNEDELIRERTELVERHHTNLNELDKKIAENHKNYEYLHDLLTLSGAELVKTVEHYFAWLGFDEIENVDETNPGLNEEDLRIKCEEGLLVVEVKGINGTSSDEDCSQISKVKYRRSEERGKFDVFGLYVVNHQRFLSPESRINPPFNETQIRDAINDKRGLLTTYDLFKLFFNVTSGFVTKEDAQKAILKIGLVNFDPSGAVRLESPYELHHNGTVVIVQTGEIKVGPGMKVVINDSGRFRSATILDVRLDDEDVEEATTGELGLKLSEPVSKESVLWVLHKPA